MTHNRTGTENQESLLTKRRVAAGTLALFVASGMAASAIVPATADNGAPQDPSENLEEILEDEMDEADSDKDDQDQDENSENDDAAEELTAEDASDAPEVAEPAEAAAADTPESVAAAEGPPAAEAIAQETGAEEETVTEPIAELTSTEEPDVAEETEPEASEPAVETEAPGDEPSDVEAAALLAETLADEQDSDESAKPTETASDESADSPEVTDEGPEDVEDPDYEEPAEVQLLQDDAEYDPNLNVAPQEITQRDLEFSGLWISGDGLEPSSAWAVSISGEHVATFTANEQGLLSGEAFTTLNAGGYTVNLSDGSLDFDFPLTVTEGGYNPAYFLDEESISQWQLATQGLGIAGNGFSADSTVTVLVGGTLMGEFVTDGFGEFEGTLTGELASGEHQIEVVSSSGTPTQQWSTTLTVLNDDDYYDEVDPSAWSNREVVTESGLNDSPIQLWGSGFPGGEQVDLLINGEFVTSVTASNDLGSGGEVEGELSGPLEPGEYTATWQHAAGSASVTFIVIPDEPGDPAPTGEYVGTSVQGSAGGRELDDPIDFDFSFDIDADGNITSLATRYWWVCAVGGYQGSGYGDLTDIPETQLTVGRPFEIHWGDDVSNNYVLRGVVNADGAASGTGIVTSDVCGSGHFSWSAGAEGIVVPDPEPTTDPTDEPTDPAPSEDPTSDPTPDPTSDPTSEPTTEPTAGPTADPTDEPSTGGIEAPSEAAAGSEITITVGEDHTDQQVSIWLYSDPIHLGDPTVSANGTVSASLPADASGDHTLRVYTEAGDLIGSAPITITFTDNDDDAGDEDGTDSVSGTGGGSAGSDDDDPASTDEGGDDDSTGDAGSGDGTSSDSPDTDGGSTEDKSAGDDSTETAGDAVASGDDSGSETGGLAATGTAAALIAIGAGLLMLLGVGVLSISRRRTS